MLIEIETEKQPELSKQMQNKHIRSSVNNYNSQPFCVLYVQTSPSVKGKGRQAVEGLLLRPDQGLAAK